VGERVVVLKAGSTLAGLRARRGDYEDWIAAGLGVARGRLQLVAVHEGEALPDPEASGAVIVTGSAAMVSAREPWSERAAAWLRDAAHAGAPLLGICFGHQLLAHALGGRVGANPRGREMGTVEVTLRAEARADPLLGALGSPLLVQVTHLESVLELPPGARVLASNAADPHQAFAWGERVWGVQFHPEFDAEVMRAYLEERRPLLRAEGIDPEPLERDVSESPHGKRLLRRFARLFDL
jgi:GMP synthase (glutamine-hydrolysing)